MTPPRGADFPRGAGFLSRESGGAGASPRGAGFQPALPRPDGVGAAREFRFAHCRPEVATAVVRPTPAAAPPQPLPPREGCPERSEGRG